MIIAKELEIDDNDDGVADDIVNFDIVGKRHSVLGCLTASEVRAIKLSKNSLELK